MQDDIVLMAACCRLLQQVSFVNVFAWSYFLFAFCTALKYNKIQVALQSFSVFSEIDVAFLGQIPSTTCIVYMQDQLIAPKQLSLTA